jgi:hypothetical protein
LRHQIRVSEESSMRNPRRAYDSNGKLIPPVTLAHMRDHGVRSVDAYCEARGCGHMAIVLVDDLPDELPVPDVSLRLRCSRCGNRQIHTGPNWAEMTAAGMGRKISE